MLLYALNLSR